MSIATLLTFSIYFQKFSSNMPSPTIFTSAFLFAMVSTANCFTEEYFTAAVFEYATQSNLSTPSEIIETNLAYYKKATEVAKSKGADIIIFPEYGIFPASSREELKHFLENTPDPKVIQTNPCNESESYSNRPILFVLSCMAKQNSIVVVANTGDIQPCRGEPRCPPDGDLHFNTNVAFDSVGNLIGRYHKERLFFEDGMDLPRVPQDPNFITDFGKFGMFVCFDVVFKKITEIAKEGVEAILLPTAWIDPTPFMTSVQLWQSWAYTNNVTFLAANLQMPGYFSVGSGIFHAKQGPLAYTYNPDGISKLVVAKVPRGSSPSTSPESSISAVTLNETSNYTDDGSRVPQLCSRKILGDTKDPRTDYRCLEEDTSNYTFVKLDKSKGVAEACNNGLCCSVEYEALNITQNYYLGVYNGTYNMFDRYFWCEQNCLVVRCDSFGNNSCATFPMRTDTVFLNVHLSANITSEYIYPSILASGMRLIPNDDWLYEFENGKATISYARPTEILVIGLNGRCYDRDPPYIR